MPAAAARKPVVFGGEAKALAELLEGDQEDTLQEAPLESTEVEEGMTDILAAVQASQLRDRQFATNSSGHIAAGYHSSEDDDENEVKGCSPTICLFSRHAHCPCLACLLGSTNQLDLSSMSRLERIGSRTGSPAMKSHLTA